MNDLKKFNIGVSVGFLKVENTEIEVLAKNQEHTEDLALDYAKQNHNSCDWRDCPIQDLNYQIEYLKI